MRDRDREADELLPLSPATFHILVALADGDRHGYGIIRDVSERTDGTLRLGPGTLYRTIQRMVEDGLIVEASARSVQKDLARRDARDPRENDERRRYYRMTPLGTAAAKAETERLAQLVRMARARGLTPGQV